MPLRAEDGRNGVTAGGGLNQEHEPTPRNDDGGVGSLVAALANRLGDSGRWSWAGRSGRCGGDSTLRGPSPFDVARSGPPVGGSQPPESSIESRWHAT